MCNAAQALYDVVQAPDGICAHGVLGFATHAVQGHTVVVVDGRVYLLNNFYLNIVSSSARKSEVRSKSGFVHDQYQKKLFQQYDLDRSAYEDAKEGYKKAREAILIDALFIET